jgi:hypothetical protein
MPPPLRPADHLSSAIKMLTAVFAYGRELDALGAWDIHGLLRMRQVVQIKRAQMDFEHFTKSLVLELTNLHTSLSEALSIVIEAREMTSNTAGLIPVPRSGCKSKVAESRSDIASDVQTLSRAGCGPAAYPYTQSGL